jgi:hypothetical protein
MYVIIVVNISQEENPGIIKFRFEVQPEEMLAVLLPLSSLVVWMRTPAFENYVLSKAADRRIVNN